MIEERIRLTDERQQFGKQVIPLGLEHIDVPGAHATEVGDGNLPLVGTALPEQDLARVEDIRKGHPVSDVAPTADLQITRLQVFKADVSLKAARLRVL